MLCSLMFPSISCPNNLVSIAGNKHKKKCNLQGISVESTWPPYMQKELSEKLKSETTEATTSAEPSKPETAGAEELEEGEIIGIYSFFR